MRRAVAAMVLLVLVAALAMTSGCATFSKAIGDNGLPSQEEASVENEAVKAHSEVAKKLADSLPQMVNRATFKPLDPNKPMVLDNVMVEVVTVDSRAYDTMAGLVDLTRYKSAPGFWSFMLELAGLGHDVLRSPLLPVWLTLDSLTKLQPNQVTYAGSFNATGRQNQVAIVPGNGSGITAAPQANPVTQTTTTITDDHSSDDHSSEPAETPAEPVAGKR